MRESGENPEHSPLLYVLEAAVRDVSRSLGKPEKAERQTQRRFSSPNCTSQKTYDDRVPRKAVSAALCGNWGTREIGRGSWEVAALFCLSFFGTDQTLCRGRRALFRRLSRWKHAYKLLQSVRPMYVRRRPGGEHGARSDSDADRGTRRGGKPPLMQKSPFLCWRRGTRSVARNPPRFLQAAFIISNPRPGRPNAMSGQTGGMVNPSADCCAVPGETALQLPLFLHKTAQRDVSTLRRFPFLPAV